MTPLHHC